MPNCSMCGTEYSISEARDEFECECSYPFDNFRSSVCLDCARDIINNEIDGYYFEECEECGKSFDLYADVSEFALRNSNFIDADLRDAGRILCCDCACDAIDEIYPPEESF